MRYFSYRFNAFPSSFSCAQTTTEDDAASAVTQMMDSRETRLLCFDIIKRGSMCVWRRVTRTDNRGRARWQHAASIVLCLVLLRSYRRGPASVLGVRRADLQYSRSRG